MELPNEVKAAIVRGRIEAATQEQYGLIVDHEVQTLVKGNPTRLAEIEAGLAACVRALQILNARLDELIAPQTNGSEKEHANAA